MADPSELAEAEQLVAADPGEPAGFADEVLDELLPEELDWRRLVSRYPRLCLAAATLAGFWVGRRKGRELVEAVSSFVADQVSSAVEDALHGPPEA